MDIKSFAGWCVRSFKGPADKAARAAVRPIVTPRPAQQMELSPTVPTLIAWVSFVSSTPQMGQKFNKLR
jgi:hypothetical protein